MSTSAIAHIRRVAPGGVGDDEIRAMLEATGRDPARVRAALEAWWRREDGEGSGSDSGASARPPRGATAPPEPRGGRGGRGEPRGGGGGRGGRGRGRGGVRGGPAAARAPPGGAPAPSGDPPVAAPARERRDGGAPEAKGAEPPRVDAGNLGSTAARGAARNANVPPECDARVVDRFDTSASAALRALAERTRLVQT